MKAQVEFVAVLAAVVIIVVVAYFAFQTSQFPSDFTPAGTSAEQSLVRDRLAGIASDGASLSISWMERQGGTLIPDLSDSVSFTRVMVPYWQKCGTTNVPSLDFLTELLENATHNYIVNSIANRTEEVLGKDVEADLMELDVKANILDNKVELAINLPMTVQGQPVQHPVMVSVPTKFGEIYKFMKAYSEEAAQNRYMELFMVNSIYFSKYVDEGGSRHQELPTFGVMTECGETLDRSPGELSDYMEGIVDYTLSHVRWWEGVESDLSKPKVYSIESLDGKTYPQLNPLFRVDDNFGIELGGGLHLSNPKPVARAPALGFTTSGLCLGTYFMSYSFRTPVILQAEDTLTGDPFNIATLVDINDLGPGTCGEMPGTRLCTYGPGGSMNCTDGASGAACECHASITVLMPDGRPASGALASFGGCILPKTNANGKASGYLACGTGDLFVYKAKALGSQKGLYQSAACGADFDGINNSAFTLYEYPNITIRMREVNVSDCSASAASGFAIVNATHSAGCGSLFINLGGPVGACRGTSACEQMPTEEQQQACILSEAQESCASGFSGLSLVESVSQEMQPGSYLVGVEMFDMASPGTASGAMGSSFEIAPTTRQLFLNVPLHPDASSMNATAVLNLTVFMEQECGIGAVTEVDVI